jgi:hypothetical protein
MDMKKHNFLSEMKTDQINSWAKRGRYTEASTHWKSAVRDIKWKRWVLWNFRCVKIKCFWSTLLNYSIHPTFYVSSKLISPWINGWTSPQINYRTNTLIGHGISLRINYRIYPRGSIVLGDLPLGRRPLRPTRQKNRNETCENFSLSKSYFISLK